jgi:hypothetical protein
MINQSPMIRNIPATTFPGIDVFFFLSWITYDGSVPEYHEGFYLRPPQCMPVFPYTPHATLSRPACLHFISMFQPTGMR